MGVFDFCHGKSTEPTGCPDVPIADIKDDRFNVGQCSDPKKLDLKA